MRQFRCDRRSFGAAGHDALTVKSGKDYRGRPSVLVSVGYPDYPKWMGIHLTRNQVTKLRDWLTEWLKETKP